MKIFLLNAPPLAGKDTAGTMLRAHFAHSTILKFAAPLKEGVAAIFCSGDTQRFAELDSPEQKGLPHEEFFGATTRQVQIDLAEKFIKPNYGVQALGYILANAVSAALKGPVGHEEPLFFITDSGFREEAEILVNRFGAENIVLIRIHRANCTYDKDSRSYISLMDLNIKEFDVDNDGTYGEFRDKLIEIVNEVKNND